MKYRTEFDSIGKIKVAGDKYWGASTERSNKYFNIGDFLVRPIVIHSIAIIKKAAAIVNKKNKDLDPKITKYIVRAAEEVMKGKLDSHLLKPNTWVYFVDMGNHQTLAKFDSSHFINNKTSNKFVII